MDREIAYLLPAWIFDGLIFVARPEIRSYEELREQNDANEARSLFLAQLRGKKLAIPEGSVHDQGFRAFVSKTRHTMADFSVVNTKLDAGTRSDD